MFNLSTMDSADRHRKLKFLRKFVCADNYVCKLVEHNARHEQRYLGLLWCPAPQAFHAFTLWGNSAAATIAVL